MPPKKPSNTVLAEESLAERIAVERERAGMSPASLAFRMTQAGCPMTQSAIWKIENGNPRRRITFDEAVTFAKVFEMPIQELAAPVEVVRAEKATDLLRQIASDDEMRKALTERWESNLHQIALLVSQDPTGTVAVAVNHALGAEPASFDVELWRGISDEEERWDVVDSWMDVCVSEADLTVVPLDLTDARVLPNREG